MPVLENIDPFFRADCFDTHKVTFIILFLYLSISHKSLFLWNYEYFASKYFCLAAYNKTFQGYKFNRVAYCLYKLLKHWNWRVKTAGLGYGFFFLCWFTKLQNRSKCEWKVQIKRWTVPLWFFCFPCASCGYSLFIQK